MFKWFRDCKTCEAGKARYRDLVRQYHPDNGASGEEMKEITVEFKIWFERFKNIHETAKGETYTQETESTETPEDFMDIINNLSTIPNISVEICGTWLWISGNTYPVRTQLTSFGCRWSKGKKKWYWTTDEYSRVRYKTPTMAQIRQMYGSQKVKFSTRLQIES